MCYYSTEVHRHWVSHYVRCHRFDPRFSVRCSQPGCAATYTNWSSYKKHFQRNHRHVNGYHENQAVEHAPGLGDDQPPVDEDMDEVAGEVMRG